METTYYVTVRFEIKPENFETLSSLIKEFFAEVSVCPGFISSRILVNEDQTKVLNFATWESKEKFDAFASGIASTSKTVIKIQAFKPVREKFYEVEYLAKIS